jgi:uncharacterized protein YkwD
MPFCYEESLVAGERTSTVMVFSSKESSESMHLIPIVFLLTLPFGASAAPADRLIELINEYRADLPVCEGQSHQPLPPLAPDSRLAQAQIGPRKNLQQALQESGFRASQVEAVSLSGPPNAQQAFSFATDHHCRVLLSKSYSAIGVSRQGNEWQIVLAQPLVSGDLGSWQAAGKQVLEQVNEARGRQRSCGGKAFEPAPPLRWNEALGAAAREHSRDMAQHSRFTHAGSGGSMVAARAEAQGYRWRHIGENIAAGQGAPKGVVQGWLSSPEHCANIMNDDFTEMGAAYAYDEDSQAGIYWTQVFGTPR